jgi:hypothetical protein
MHKCEIYFTKYTIVNAKHLIFSNFSSKKFEIIKNCFSYLNGDSSVADLDFDDSRDFFAEVQNLKQTNMNFVMF